MHSQRKILGISEGFHDASACLIQDGQILSATHSERFSRKKNDRWLHPLQKVEADLVAFYEKPWLKKTRQIYAGQGWKRTTTKYDVCFYHHQSHAAAAYYTRPSTMLDPVTVVIDAIGEWDTCSIWYRNKKVWSKKYPFSLGLFYSAITQAVGLNPNEDEYITMGMAAYGQPIYDLNNLLNEDLHRGVGNYFKNARKEDIAASAQYTIEQEILKIMHIARNYSPDLCYGGGVALNCVANSKIVNLFNSVWIMPNPGDAGSALGAAALAYGGMLNWQSPYLGTNIDRKLSVKNLVNHLLQHKICGVANGRAEYGPRALGNRSLLADPRHDIKDTVNDIKRRQRYRPFAPAILEEFADEYFEGPMNEYMQYVAKAKHDYRSVTHVDGTARVQIVKKDCQSVLRQILEYWYERTRCPMLLNTSLNIKGLPIVDNLQDAIDFEKEYKVRVF